MYDGKRLKMIELTKKVPYLTIHNVTYQITNDLAAEDLSRIPTNISIPPGIKWDIDTIKSYIEDFTGYKTLGFTVECNMSIEEIENNLKEIDNQIKEMEGQLSLFKTEKEEFSNILTILKEQEEEKEYE